MTEDREDKTIYKVVVNHEEQYSIWPTHRERGVFGLHQRSVDRHASVEFEEEDGGTGLKVVLRPHQVALDLAFDRPARIVRIIAHDWRTCLPPSCVDGVTTYAAC
jgi:hypothetical protein